MASTSTEGTFEELWNAFFVSHVGGQQSFFYILDRTLLRPREVLRFLRDCIDVAVNRGHERVHEEDIKHAEFSYSDDALVDLSLELRDVSPEFANVPYAFIGTESTLSTERVEELIKNIGVRENQIRKVLDLLLWFSFVGIHTYPDEERYAYLYQHNVKKMSSGITKFRYSIHPAFRRALGTIEI